MSFIQSSNNKLFRFNKPSHFSIPILFFIFFLSLSFHPLAIYLLIHLQLLMIHIPHIHLSIFFQLYCLNMICIHSKHSCHHKTPHHDRPPHSVIITLLLLLVISTKFIAAATTGKPQYSSTWYSILSSTCTLCVCSDLVHPPHRKYLFTCLYNAGRRILQKPVSPSQVRRLLFHLPIMIHNWIM